MRLQSKIHSLAHLAAARATCQPAAAARRSQASRGAHPTQNAGVHPRPRAHGSAATAACPPAYAGGGPWWRICTFNWTTQLSYDTRVQSKIHSLANLVLARKYTRYMYNDDPQEVK